MAIAARPGPRYHWLSERLQSFVDDRMLHRRIEQA